MLQPPPEQYHRSRLKMGGVAFLMVIFLLFLLVTLPVLRNSRESAWRAQCLSNLKQLGLALHMYSSDYDGRFPATGSPRGQGGVASLELLYPGYASDPNLFICPADDHVTPWDGKGRLSAAHCSYGYDHAHSSDDPADVAIAADCTGIEKGHDGLPTCHYYSGARRMGGYPGGWGTWNGMNVLYIDGHVKWAGKNRSCGRKDDDLFTKSETLPPEEDSWITQ